MPPSLPRKTRPATRGSNARACWSACTVVLRVQAPPALVDSRICTPATQMCCSAAGSTQIRPNHQPYVDCALDRNDVFVMRVHDVPPFVEVQNPVKFPVVSAAIAYIRLGLLRAIATPIRPRLLLAPGSPPATRVHVVPPSVERNSPDPTPPYVRPSGCRL